MLCCVQAVSEEVPVPGGPVHHSAAHSSHHLASHVCLASTDQHTQTNCNTQALLSCWVNTDSENNVFVKLQLPNQLYT